MLKLKTSDAAANAAYEPNTSDPAFAAASFYSVELLAIFNMAPEPHWLCDNQGLILLVNSAALFFETKGSGIKVQDNALVAQVQQGRQTLSLKDAIALSAGQPYGWSCSIAGTADPAFLHIVPLNSPSAGAPADRFVVCFIKSNPPDLECGRLKMLLGLTEAEARLVRMLVLDHSVREIAKQARITPNTVRSKLKSIFRKTGVRGQTELVRLVLTLTRAFRIRPRL